MSFESKAASITPPVKGKNVWVLQASDFDNTAVSLTIPDAWKGAYLTLEAETADWYFALSNDATATITATSASTVSGGEITAIGAGARKIVAGTGVDVDLGEVRDFTQLELLSSGATGFLRITRSSGSVSKDS